MESVATRRGKRKANNIDPSVQQSPKDQQNKSRFEKAEKGLFVVQHPQNQPKISSRTKNSDKSSEKVLSPLRDLPQTSAAEKAIETEAPTLQTALREAKQTIEGQKSEIDSLKEWVNTIKEERDFLRERLKEALAVRSNIPPTRQAHEQRKQESGKSDFSSSDASTESDSEPDSDTSETKKPKKSFQPKKAKKKGKKLRVKTPGDSIRRYNMVLETLKKRCISKAEAYTRLGVDRNTIVSQAPINLLH